MLWTTLVVVFVIQIINVNRAPLTAENTRLGNILFGYWNACGMTCGVVLLKPQFAVLWPFLTAVIQKARSCTTFSHNVQMSRSHNDYMPNAEMLRHTVTFAYRKESVVTIRVVLIPENDSTSSDIIKLHNNAWFSWNNWWKLL